jgi:hypothetical protein
MAPVVGYYTLLTSITFLRLQGYRYERNLDP